MVIEHFTPLMFHPRQSDSAAATAVTNPPNNRPRNRSCTILHETEFLQELIFESFYGVHMGFQAPETCFYAWNISLNAFLLSF